MSLLNELKKINENLEVIKKSIVVNELTDFEKEYKEYRAFADARGMKMLSEAGLVDEYNQFMSECEELLFSDVEKLKIELPKPSSALEAFKNKFNKFF